MRLFRRIIRERGRRVPVLAAVCAVWALSAPLAGCTRPGLTRAPAESEPYRFESEGQVPPPDESAVRREVDRVDVFEETAVSDSSLAVQNVEPVEEAPPSETAADTSLQIVPGYRIQVFATGIRESAEQVKIAVETAIGERAYVERVDGIFKVRVGDCRSRPEAEDLLQRCRAAGYGDAWIVSSQVVYRRPDR